jgi:hypothetical protein
MLVNKDADSATAKTNTAKSVDTDRISDSSSVTRWIISVCCGRRNDHVCRFIK